MKILVTGSSGFIGKRLCNFLANKGYKVVPIVRANPKKNEISIGDMSFNTDWSNVLINVDVVVHLAARVHVMNESKKDPLHAFIKVNTATTINLAKQAAKNGVKRLIFISSVKVNGESTPLNKPFTEIDIPVPTDPYSISKFNAEKGLFQLAQETGIEVVCIRPPLVYGDGVKANFFNMMKWLNRGVPLPFGAINNKRSLVALDNLVDFIVTCITHPNAANQVFLVSDGEDLSTTELLTRVAISIDKKVKLLPVHERFLECCLFCFGQKNIACRFCYSLQVDINKAKKLLNWSPPISVDEGLRSTAKYFINL